MKDLYKNEVNSVAKTLDLPAETVEKRPFPVPELSVHVMGEVNSERIEAVRKVTEIIEAETKDVTCFQAFGVLLNDRATGRVKLQS